MSHREEMRVSSLELFFDLVFVFGVTQVTRLLHHPDTVAAFSRGLLVLVMLWWTWSTYAWIVNFTGTASRGARVALITAGAASLVMAAAVGAAFDERGAWFAGALFVVRTLGQVGYWVGTAGDEAVRSALRSYLPAAFVAPGLFLAGGLVGDPLRTWLWVAGIAVDTLAVFLAGRGEWSVAPQHFAERHGLIVIIALGESVVAIGVAAATTPPGIAWLLALVAAFAGAGALWWAYFEHCAEPVEQTLVALSPRERGQFARDAYTLLHFPLVVGIVLFAVAAESVMAYPSESLDGYGRFALAAGPALVLLGTVAILVRSAKRIPWSRPLGALVLVAVAVGGSGWPGWAIGGAAVFAVVAVLLAEMPRRSP